MKRARIPNGKDKAYVAHDIATYAGCKELGSTCEADCVGDPPRYVPTRRCWRHERLWDIAERLVRWRKHLER